MHPYRSQINKFGKVFDKSTLVLLDSLPIESIKWKQKKQQYVLPGTARS